MWRVISIHFASIIGYAISQIFQRGVKITKIVAFQACSLHLGYLEKWLIQFLNPPNHWINRMICDFPNFSVRCNNYKDCSISSVFSALWAPRKVVDTIFELHWPLIITLNHWDQSYDTWFPEFFNMTATFY